MNFHADNFNHHDLISFANEWVALGSSIQEQVEYIINVDPKDQDEAEVNENAIDHAKRSGVYGVSPEIDDAIDSYIEYRKRMNAIEDAIEDDPGEAGECAAAAEGVSFVEPGEFEECAPTAEAVRLIQGGNPWATDPEDKPAPDVMCESKRPDGTRVQLTVPPKRSPLARMLPVQKLTTADLTPENYINDVVLDIQMDDSEFLVAYYLDGKFREEPTYYASDYEDAKNSQQTMKEEAEQAGHRVALKETMRRINRNRN